MSGKGFMDRLISSFSLWAAVQDSKDSSGKPDPYKAAGIAYGARSDLSTAELLELGGYLGSEGAFDSDGFMPSADHDCRRAASNSIHERHSMNWPAPCEEEKQRRIRKAQHTKALHRYWQALWKYEELVTSLSPVGLAETVWKEVVEKDRDSGAPNPTLRNQFAKWVRKNHDIRMDSKGNMHLIKHKNENAK